MDFDALLRLIIFAVAGFLTPGQNTMMVLASAVNFGFQRTAPHIAGIMAGTGLVFWAVGFGLNLLLALYPFLKITIQIIGVVYLLYLTFKIAGAGNLSNRAATKPVTFWQALLLQFVNVKLMGVAAGALVTYPVTGVAYHNTLIVGLVAGVINGPCVSMWGIFGSRMREFLAKPAVLRLFNLILAGLILLTLVPVIGDILASMRGI